MRANLLLRQQDGLMNPKNGLFADRLERRILPDIAPHNRPNFRQMPQNSKAAM
ncbi:MAG TPA: hypothetical protein VN685_00015 [Rhizomicrobium sp.]|nr:hypothetical protein [Rhizomicrobium sp.]